MSQATQTKLDVAAIERFLRVRGWNKATTCVPGESGIAYTSKDGDWRVEIDEAISIQRFTDSDVEDDRYKGGCVAAGRYEDISEVLHFEELEPELVSLGAIAFCCPWCGSEGGEPTTSTYRYHYGADADGNRGEWREDVYECCTKCKGRQ